MIHEDFLLIRMYLHVGAMKITIFKAYESRETKGKGVIEIKRK